MNAVVQIGGNQYMVQEGKELLVPKLNGTGELRFNSVLMVIDGETTKIGTPSIENFEVVVQVQGDEKGEKVRVTKFKAKSRYRKVRGFRPQYTRLKVLSIGEAKSHSNKQTEASTENTAPTAPVKVTKPRKSRETKA